MVRITKSIPVPETQARQVSLAEPVYPRITLELKVLALSTN